MAKTKDRLPPLVMENCEIRYRNFSGKEGVYNREGDRNFCVLISPEMAVPMEKDGWNVKYLKAREPGEDPQPYIQVAVSYKYRPPRIVLVTGRGKNNLEESDINILDWVDIINVDLIINPSYWEVSGDTGIKAYLSSIYITIQEDKLEQKYADVPDSAQRSTFEYQGDKEVHFE